MAEEATTVDVDGEAIRITSPGKVMFPDRGWTKMDVVEHFVACADGALGGVFGRPTLLKRWPGGVGQAPFHQKRAQASLGERVVVRFPSGRSAAYFVPRTPGDIVRMAQLNCLDFNPWNARAEDLEHPDELRIDLDPTPQATFSDVKTVALVVEDILDAHGLVGWPKTSGSKGIHIYVRIHPRWGFFDVRMAALAVGREVEAVVPQLATTAWWKHERHGVFIDYNQNSRDRSLASAYSVRPTGWVSAPLTWDELPDAELEDFPMIGFADRYERLGDPMEGIEDTPGSIESLLALGHRLDG